MRTASSSFSGKIFRNLIGNIFGPLAGLASAPILAQTLGVTGRGEVAGATAPFLLVVAIATFGIPEAVTYTVARSPELLRRTVRNASWMLLAAGIIATAGTLLLAPLVTVSDPHLAPLIALTATAIVPYILVGGLRGMASGLERWDLVAYDRATGPIVRLAVVAVLAATGNLDVVTATAAIAFSPILGGLFYVPLLLKSPKLHGDAVVTGSRSSDIARYGSRIWIGAIAGVLLMRIDQLLMVPLAGAFQLGLYAVAVTISELPLILNTAVREVMFASDARKSRDDLMGSAARTSLLVCVAFAALIGGTAPWWLPLAFGEGFAAALPACLVLLAAVALGVPGSVAGAGLSARGRPELRSYSLLIACAINISVLVALVPIMGAIGASVATLVGNLISSNLNIIWLTKRSDLRFQDFYLVRSADFRQLWKIWVRLLRRGQD